MTTSSSRGGPADPWRIATDPAANIRALGDVQRRALEAAAAVVDRLVRAVDGPRPDAGAEPDLSGEPVGAAEIRQLAQVWSEAMMASVQSLATVAGAVVSPPAPGATSAGPRIDVGGAAPASGLAISGPAGVASRSQLWVHNATGEDRDGLRLHCGDLRSSTGTTIPEGAVTFDPAEIDRLPARSSRGVQVEVQVPRSAPAGAYVGLVMADGLPRAWLPLTVEVTR